MIADAFLRITPEAGSLPGTIGNPADFQPAPFPSGYIVPGGVSSYDLGAISDLGRGRTGLRARFTVTEAFSAPGDWRAFFGIIVGRNGDLSQGAQLIAQSGPNTGVVVGYTASGLPLGAVDEIMVPGLASIARLSEAGFQFIGLCMSIKSPTSPATQGLVRAQFVLDGIEEQYLGLRFPASGFSVVTE